MENISDYSEISQSGVVSSSLDALSTRFSAYKMLPVQSHQSCNVLYRAHRYGRYYVLKGLAPKYRNDTIYREFLSKEYQIGVQLDHPHIVRVNSLEEDPTLGLCIVMEYVDGHNLEQWLESRPSFTARRRIFQQILEAIAYCHDRQVWHLDLKPSNILITEDGLTAKIIDFGLSDNSNFVLRQNGGTRKYASPEQLEGKPSDLRGDIYALGGILKYMFPHHYKRAVRHAQRTDPDKRPQSVAELERFMHSRWWLWLLPVLAIVAFCWWMRPDGKIFPVTLDSGQTVYARVLSHWHRTVTFVCPDMVWVTRDIPDTPSGDLAIPASIKYRGLQYHVTELDPFAFSWCKKITHVTFPEGLQRIGYSAFGGCYLISDTIVIPRSLKIMEHCVFEDCHSLTTLIWKALDCSSGGFEVNIKAPFYRCSSLRKVIVDDEVEVLPNVVFSRIENCEEIVLPNTLRELPKDFASHSFSLKSINLPDSLRIVGYGAFYMSDIESITIPDETNEIDSYSFAYCRKLRQVDLGKGVKKMGGYAFNDNEMLQTMIVRCDEPPLVMSTSLYELPLSAVLRVPAQSIEKYRQHKIWGQFKTIEAIEIDENL